MKALPDVVAPGLRILFVGINPGLRSAEIGHHFGGRTNPFWRLLHAAGLTPVQLPPEEDRRLLEFGLGVTNICPRPTRSSSELGRDELAAGARTLNRKIARLRPRWVALVGLTIYAQLYPRGERGAGEKLERPGGARLYVLPNPSGLNASFPGFREKLIWFERLAQAAGPSPRDGGAGCPERGS